MKGYMDDEYNERKGKDPRALYLQKEVMRIKRTCLAHCPPKVRGEIRWEGPYAFEHSARFHVLNMDCVEFGTLARALRPATIFMRRTGTANATTVSRTYVYIPTGNTLHLYTLSIALYAMAAACFCLGRYMET